MPTGYYSCVADDTSGHQAEQAFERFEILEFAAKTLIKASILGTPRPLADDDSKLGPPPSPLPHFDPGTPPAGKKNSAASSASTAAW